MRYVIYGAGAVGGVIGAGLALRGREVVLIARGAHLDAIRERGLRFESPRGTETVRCHAAGGPGEIDWSHGDVAVLATKTQDTAAALEALRASAGPDVPVFCAQNGVENERLAARLFRRVYGVMVFLPATHLEPGVIQSNGHPVDGILHVGCYPGGADHLAMSVARDLQEANFTAPVVEDIMRWKYAKLLGNLNNAVQAICGAGVDVRDVATRIQDEALACYRAAGIAWASPEEMREQRGDFTVKPAGEGLRGGGSSWQSLARGQGTIETDYLNGEIVLLGARHGIETPANRTVQRLANALARERTPPGAMTPEELTAAIDASR